MNNSELYALTAKMHDICRDTKLREDSIVLSEKIIAGQKQQIEEAFNTIEKNRVELAKLVRILKDNTSG